MKALKKAILYSFYALLGVLLIMACNAEKPVFEKIVAIDEGLWDKNNAISITMPVNSVLIDTLQSYDLQIYLRNRNDYPYSNIYLFVTVSAPTGAMVTDTVQYILADDHGKWLGKGFSQLWDKRYPFYSNIRFPHQGDYIVEIRQGMRQNELPGITDVGIRLVKP